LTGIDDLRNGELSARGYAAQGGIRLEASLQALADKKKLLNVLIPIPAGWHLNSNQPQSADLIATELRLAEQQQGWHMAPVTYPKAGLQQLAFQSAPLTVYSGKIQLQALLEKSTESADSSPLAVELTLQACNDEVCLPPERIVLHVSLNQSE
jgi:hypothetical protein